MILLDHREKAEYALGQYIPLAQVTTLEFGDAAVLGFGDQLVGVERKRVGDLLRVIADGRFVSEQLPGLASTYSRIYLLVEGEWTAAPDGALLVRGSRGQWERPEWGRQNGWRYAEVARWLVSLEESAGIRVARTLSPVESAAWLVNLEVEWLKDPTKRRAVSAIYQPTFGLMTPSFERKVAALLPGIGIEKSARVADHFNTVWNMVHASRKAWMEIPGIGGTIADKVYKALRGE